jgi:hypothetical protein
MSPRRAEQGAWAVAAAGLAGSLAGWIAIPRDFAYAWLAAVLVWSAWPLGSLALVLIHALTGGRWGRVIRPQLAAGIATLPLLPLLLLPLLFELKVLYPWMHAQSPLSNQFYLNAPFFYLRGLIYLGVWLGIGYRVWRSFEARDAEVQLARIAPVSLIALMLTVTFASIDYILSMEPQFKSSIFGMLAASEAVLLGLSVAVMARAFEIGRPEPARDTELGRLLLALLVLWAYLDFMQFLIVWNSDLPDEAGWYLHRLTGSWAAIAALIAVLHFVLPFLLLLWPPIQRSAPAMGRIAALLVLIEVPRAWWTVIPAGDRRLEWVDVAAMMAVLGMAAGFCLRWGRGRHGQRTPAAAAAHG